MGNSFELRAKQRGGGGGRHIKRIMPGRFSCIAEIVNHKFPMICHKLVLVVWQLFGRKLRALKVTESG